VTTYGHIIRQADGVILLTDVRWCSSFLCKFKGLMLRRSLRDGEALLFVEPYVSRVGTTIHMLFMFMSISVVWLDSEFTVVDKKLAKPWRLAYAPESAAQYYVETSPNFLKAVEIGDKLEYISDGPL